MLSEGKTASVSSTTDQVLLLWIALLVPAQGLVTNMALGKPAWQCSNLSNSTLADRAVDGNTSTNLYHGHCSATSWTNRCPVTWWMVDLQARVSISSVVIYNRADCCSSFMNQFHLELHEMNPQLCGSATKVTSIYQSAALPANDTTFTFNPPRTARWVQIIMYRNSASLDPCEVQVYGEPVIGTAAPCGASCRFNSVVLPQLGPLNMTHVSLSVGNASPTDCASLCLHHGQCLGFYFRPVVGGLPACTLLVPRPPGAPEEKGLQGPVTCFELLR